MNKIFIFLITLISFSSYSQIDNSLNESPYELSWEVDGPWVGGGLALNGLGLYLIQNKEGLSQEEVNALSKEDVWAVDRWVAGNSSDRADNISYYPFYGSFAVPFVMMLTDRQRPHAGQISVMLLETMATTGALFSISVGAIDRSRPLVYDPDVPDDQKMEPGAQRSFFAGHTAATAAASFFTAKVFRDFNPDSWAVPYVWTAAAAVPAWVGYLRHKAGKHFLTDNLLGYGIGALSGILIPEFHKKENSNISLYPSMGRFHQGITFQYTF